MGGCVGKDWGKAPVRVGPLLDPPVFVYGNVREDVARIRLVYADGDEQQIEPGAYGYVLYVIPPEHRNEATRFVEVVGLDQQGGVIDRQRFPSRP